MKIHEIKIAVTWGSEQKTCNEDCMWKSDCIGKKRWRSREDLSPYRKRCVSI